MNDFDFNAGTVYVREGVERRKGRFALTTPPEGTGSAASLICGSYRANMLEGSGGFIVILGLSRDQVEYLRSQCQAILDRLDAQP